VAAPELTIYTHELTNTKPAATIEPIGSAGRWPSKGSLGAVAAAAAQVARRAGLERRKEGSRAGLFRACMGSC